jgi:predicted peroxiredoxin
MKMSAIIGYAKDNLDKTTIGFTLANTALDGGHAVRLILASEGVRLGVKGYAEDMDNGAPFKSVKELMAAFLQKGGEINVCLPCMKKRGIEEKDILPGIKFIAGADVIAILDATEKTLQL